MAEPISLSRVRMRLVAGAEAGAVSTETLFEFEQVGEVFSARYRGGDIADGYLIGRLQSGGELEFRYVQADGGGRIDAGVSTGALIRLPDGRLQLVENFQWSTRAEAGCNVFEEIKSEELGDAMNNADPTIRGYRPNDIEPVMRVWRDANALAHPFLAEAYVTKVEDEVRNLCVPNAETYVLIEQGEVVGFIALLGNEIGGLFVDPSRHGSGYGRALVDHAVAIKGPLQVEVFRDNEIGRRFYERYGFVLVSESPHEPSGHIICRQALPGCDASQLTPPGN